MYEDNSGPTKNDSISSDASHISPKLYEATKRAIDHYLDPKPQAKKKPRSGQLFTVVNGVDTESLLANLSETLASADAMVSDLAFDLEGSRRHVALGIQQLIELGALLAN